MCSMLTVSGCRRNKVQRTVKKALSALSVLSAPSVPDSDLLSIAQLLSFTSCQSMPPERRQQSPQSIRVYRARTIR